MDNLSLVNGLINGAELNLSQNVALVFVMLWLLVKYSIYRALKKKKLQAVSSCFCVLFSYLPHAPVPGWEFHGRHYLTLWP